MRAFEVHLNGKKLCLAGIGDDGVLDASANWVGSKRGSDLFLQVGGLISSTKEHVSWVRQRRLHVGDKITVRIVQQWIILGQHNLQSRRSDPRKPSSKARETRLNNSARNQQNRMEKQNATWEKSKPGRDTRGDH